MNPSTDDVGSRSKSRAVQTGRIAVGASVFAVGLLTAGIFSRATPAAAPQDCVLPPPAPCVSPTVSVPTVSVPTVSVPTVSVPTTTTTTSTPATTTTGGTTSTTGSAQEDTPQTPAAALAAKATVRVVGRGAKRRIEIRFRVSQKAAVRAVLRRSRGVLARRQFSANAGSSVARVEVPRATKAGRASLELVYTSASGQTLRASYRLRLPR